MKKVFPVLLLGTLALSCDNKEVKQTTDTIKSADSLFKSANEGLKTLDSISAVVTDSARMNQVIIPEIEKTKKQAEEAIKNNAGRLDSITGTINKVKREIDRGSDIIKTVDSANKKLKESGNIFDKISVITGAASKISQKTAQQKPQPEADKQPNQSAAPSRTDNDAAASQNEPVYPVDPMVKTASIVVNVDKIGTKRDRVAQDLRDYGGEIVTESFGQEAGHNMVHLTAKVPYKYFGQAVNSISDNYGAVALKNIETEGTEYSADQMCDIELTFVENAAQADGMFSDSAKPNTDAPKSETGDAFNKGLKNFGNVMVWLLPFWPFLAIAGLIWYFAAHRKRKKHELELQKMQQEIETMKMRATQNTSTTASDTHIPDTGAMRDQPKDPNDYTRYMPK